MTLLFVGFFADKSSILSLLPRRLTSFEDSPKSANNHRNSILYAIAVRADLKLIASNDRMLKVKPSFEHLMLTKMDIPTGIQFLHNVVRSREIQHRIKDWDFDTYGR